MDVVMSCMKANAYTHNNNEQMPTESPHSLCNPRFSSPICLASVYTPCGLAGPWSDLHCHSGGDVMQTNLRNSVLSAHPQAHPELASDPTPPATQSEPNSFRIRTSFHDSGKSWVPAHGRANRVSCIHLATQFFCMKHSSAKVAASR